MAEIETREISRIQFKLVSPNDIRNDAVVEVVSEETFSGGKPVEGGLFDLRMGPITPNDRCMTCKQGTRWCPGHFGYLELSAPIFHPEYLDVIKKVLEAICFNCGSILLSQTEANMARILKVNRRLIKVREMIKGRRVCPRCKLVQPNITNHRGQFKLTYRFSGEVADEEKVITPALCREILKRINPSDAEAIGYSANNRPEWMILEVIPVSPPVMRPSVVTDSNQRGEDDITAHYANIIRNNRMLRGKLEQKNLPDAQVINYTSIVNFTFSAMTSGTARRGGKNVLGARFFTTRSGKPLKSIHERISGKAGRVRRNLMGKRVDYSARSVISPDPNLDLDQLGMPLEVAKILTYPEIVNDYNRERLLRYISNNKTNTYPMALNIQRGNQVRTLKHMNLEDITLETGDIVVRQLVDGDVVLFNRQPTLHRMSMMAFKIKVMSGKTFRINLSVTTPFNADFDGDEMNAHVPQSLTTSNEIWELARVSTQIVTPQSNGPIIGIVQDGLLGSFLFTRHNTRFNEQTAMNLLSVVPDFTGIVPKPLEMKNKTGWYNGRQMVSTILPAINLQKFNSSYSEKTTNPDPSYISNAKVIIRNGVLESGSLDKGTLGPKKEGSIAHVIYNDFGADQAKDFLSNLQKIINKYLLYRGFSVNLGNVVPDKALRQRMNQKIIESLEEIHELNRRVMEGRYLAPIGFSVEQHLEAQSIEKLNGVTLSVASQALKVFNPEENGLMAMVASGSKGSDINIGQITGAVGQQIINQKRVPPVYGNHRTLPIYRQYSFNPISRGFVEHSFVQGLTQPEFFFHMASGREGIIDTAIRTADSGYISRKLIKALEDKEIKNDFTVRDANGHIIQFRYGEDGINPVHIEKQKLISFEMDNTKLEEVYLFREAEVKEHTTNTIFREIFSPAKAEETKRLLREEFAQIKADRDFLRKSILTRNTNGDDTTYLPVNIRRLIVNIQNALNEKERQKKSDINPINAILRLRNLLEKLPYFFGNRLRDDWDPVENDHNASFLFRILIRSHLSSKQVIKEYKLSSIAFENLLTSIEAKYFAAIDPLADMVGIIGAQSLGEPSTQLTLNTFHYSGVASKSNITTGVPRLKELIDVSKTQKSPFLIIHLKGDNKFSKAKAETLRNQIRNTYLNEFVDKVQVFYDPRPVQNSVVKEDHKFIDDFLKYSVGRKAPLLAPWTIRFVLNRYKMFLNQMTMELIRRRLVRENSDFFPIITDENSKDAILRVQLLATTKYSMEEIIKLKDTIMNDISLRGIQGIEGSQIREAKIKLVNPVNGAIETKTEYYVDTDGTNLREVLKHPLVDVATTRSTNIIEVYEVLGIEAARNVLLEEIRQVMSDTHINYHNYAILVDTMTQMGVLTPNSRHGFNRLDKSPISKTTFEETTEQLKSASLYAEEDNMRSVSARVIFGQTIKGGTGLSEIMVDEDAFGIAEEDIEKIMGL